MDQHLSVFVTVAEKKNFSRAAEELHMTQPAVSQYIRMFEESVGTRLLERTNKYVRLNKAGEVVYHHAKEILGLYTNMQTLVDDLMNKANGPLSIGASYTFGEYVLPQIIAKLRKFYPNIEPEVTIANTSVIAEQVSAHQLDIGIVEGHFKDQQLRKEVFAADHMYVVTSPEHTLARKKIPVNIAELEQETWIVRESGSGTREATENMFRSIGISPAMRMTFSSTQPIKGTVEAGLGVSLLSQWAIQKDVRNGSLVILNVEGLPFKREFSFITKSPFQTKALEVFIDLLWNDKMEATMKE
ncbi:LysR family transcriptional regulator [Virgibacillus siamensis]|uniref:LysR family transcriptional regulator n=1 Tax=Virgibacillus siamensis TaxID=480071 RepID=UPI0009865360|nr:LysR family transcriptional regulator [Virgibacillus siamensis]